MDSFYRISPGFGAKVGNLQEPGLKTLSEPRLNRLRDYHDFKRKKSLNPLIPEIMVQIKKIIFKRSAKDARSR